MSRPAPQKRPRWVLDVTGDHDPARYLRERQQRDSQTLKLLALFGIGVPTPQKGKQR